MHLIAGWILLVIMILEENLLEKWLFSNATLKSHHSAKTAWTIISFGQSLAAYPFIRPGKF
jgi:hypothetical protein